MFSSSPRLFAAYHVFLRLPTPRHPPDALVNLLLEEQSFPTLFNCKRTLPKREPCSAWFAGTIPCAYSHEGMRQNAAAPWWAWKDLNFRPHAYQACALAT